MVIFPFFTFQFAQNSASCRSALAAGSCQSGMLQARICRPTNFSLLHHKIRELGWFLDLRLQVFFIWCLFHFSCWWESSSKGKVKQRTIGGSNRLFLDFHGIPNHEGNFKRDTKNKTTHLQKPLAFENCKRL